jgi:POT family proton-dependent oligopeptide transporter
MTNTIQSKHPKALWLIIAIYMWEYFSFYGMRALLILYLTEELLLNDTMSYAIYGSYVTLLYMTHIIGGMIADKYIGFKRAVILGAILMACGHLIIGIDGSNLLYLGMAFIICGYGHFKSNIPCLLGEMYEPHDPNRDSAFTLLYLGGNIGGVIAPIACGVVAHLYGWDYGFGLACIGMIIGLVIFLAGSKHIPEAQKHNVSNKTLLSVLGVSSVIILVCYAALEYQLEGYMLIVATIFCIIYYIKILSSSDAVVKKSLLMLIPFTLFGIVFCVFDEQIYTSVELFI